MLLSLNSCSFSESLSPLISFSVIDLLKIIYSIAFNIGSFSSFFDELKKALFDEVKKLVFIIRFEIMIVYPPMFYYKYIRKKLAKL